MTWYFFVLTITLNYSNIFQNQYPTYVAETEERTDVHVYLKKCHDYKDVKKKKKTFGEI